jgi:hypothetical protein
MGAFLLGWSSLVFSVLTGCLPASWLSFPLAEEARQRSDPTETQVFPVLASDARKAARTALIQNGFDIDRDEPDFISAKERVWARTWAWDYAAGIYVFKEDPARTRIMIVIKGAPDISMPLTLGLTALAQAAEARRIRMQLFDAIQAILEAQYY